MDTYYDVENTNTGGMIVNVTEKKGDDTNKMDPVKRTQEKKYFGA